MNKKALAIASIISTLLGILLIFELTRSANYRNEVVNKKRDELLIKTNEAAILIDAQLVFIQNKATDLAYRISRGSIDYRLAMSELKQMMDTNNMLLSASIAYQPAYSPGGHKLFAPLLKRASGDIVSTCIEKYYDYTDTTEPLAKWYTSTLKNGAHWSSPFYGGASKNILSTYTTPFCNFNSSGKKGKPTGVIVLCISIDYLSNYIKSLDLGSGAYGALVSYDGRYFVHPIDNYITCGKTIYEIGLEKNDETRLNWWRNRKTITNGILDHKSTTTGLSSFFIFSDLPLSKFSLHNTVLISDFIIDVDIFRHGLIQNIIASFFFSLSLLSIYLIIKGITPRYFWFTSVYLSILLVSCVVLVWHFSLKYHPKKKHPARGIINTTSNIVEQNALIRQYHRFGDKEIFRIPTGVLVDDICIGPKSTITVLGSIWQKFDNSLPLGVPKDIVFPNAEVLAKNIVSNEQFGNYSICTWKFKIEIKQKFDLKRYPLNFEIIRLQIHQSDGAYKVIPVPDIMAYRVTAPISKPGIKKDLHLPGWEIKESSFVLYTETPDVHISRDTAQMQNFYPALSFDIIIQKKFMDVFIAYLTPLILVLFLLFVGLVISNAAGTVKKSLNTSVANMINFLSGLLFVLCYTHIDIRRNVDSDDIFLLEYLFLFSYGMFMYVIINVILYAIGYNKIFICYKDNLLYKVFFWPLILTYIFIISIKIMY